MEKGGKMVFSSSYNNPTLYLCGIHHTGLRAKRAKLSIPPPPSACLVFVSLSVKWLTGSHSVPNRDGSYCSDIPADPRPRQHKLFSSFCHSLGSICRDLTRQHIEQRTKGRGSSPCSRHCRSVVIRVSPWQVAARLLKPIAGKWRGWYTLPCRLIIAFVTQWPWQVSSVWQH